MSKVIYTVIKKQMSNFWFYLLSFVIFFLIILPYIPSNEVTQIVEYIIYLSPRWFFILLLIPILLFWNILSKYHRLFLFFYTIILVNFQDANLNIPVSIETSNSIKLLSLNMGGGSNSKYLKTLMKREDPDVFLFQETSIGSVKEIFSQPWQLQCDSGLCIASKYPFNKVGELNRRMFGGWGNFATYYNLDINGKSLPLMNVHLETPRHILSVLLGLSIDWQGITKFRDNKSLEASLISKWASSQPYFVMSGDFNMTTNESLYRDYFLSFKNALDTVGFGFNYTKYTSWHGVRIDHVLTSDNIQIERAEVMPSLGGDHRAIVINIALP